MQEFDINLHSFSQVQKFVSLATVQPFKVTVGNEHQQVNAESLIGMISLDYSQPVWVRADCGDEEFYRFRTAVADLEAQ